MSASGFTKSARLRAKRDKRIDLVELSEVPVVGGNTVSPTVTPVWLKYRIKAANLSWSDPRNGIPPELMTTFNLAQVDVEFSDGERMTLLDVIVRVIPTAIMQIQPPPVDSFFVDCRELDWMGLHAGGVRYARPDSYQVFFSWNMERSKIERYMRFTTAMGLDVTTQVWFDGARFVQTSAVHRVGEMGSHIHISNHPLESRTGRERGAEGP